MYTPHVLLTAAIALLLPQAHVVHDTRPVLGTVVQISVWTDAPNEARTAITAAWSEIARLEAIFSEWQPNSEVSRINRGAADQRMRLSLELHHVLRRALHIGVQSSGAFDVTWAALRGLWDFRSARIPAAAQVEEATHRVGLSGLSLDDRSVRFLRPGMQLGLGGIAKGYIVDRVSALLCARGLSDHIIDAGGDVFASGSKGDTPWRVGIQHPRTGEQTLMGVVTAHDGAVVTSGDYQRFFIVDQVRYHHILDPKTGRPARGVMSVTVIARSAMDADAMATAAFVLGPERGLRFLTAQPDVEGVIVDTAGRIRMTNGARTRVNLSVDRIE